MGYKSRVCNNIDGSLASHFYSWMVNCVYFDGVGSSRIIKAVFFSSWMDLGMYVYTKQTTEKLCI